MSLEITFTEGAIEPVLEAFGKRIDTDGYIIESDTGERVLTPENNEIKADNLAVLAEGSDVFIEDNFVSLVNYYHDNDEED